MMNASRAYGDYVGTSRGYREYEHCLRAGLSKKTALACASHVERVVAARGPNKVVVPRTRCKFYNRG